MKNAKKNIINNDNFTKYYYSLTLFIYLLIFTLIYKTNRGVDEKNNNFKSCYSVVRLLPYARGTRTGSSPI